MTFWGELSSFLADQYDNALTVPKVISGGKYIKVYDVVKTTKELKEKRDTIKRYINVLRKLNNGTYGY